MARLVEEASVGVRTGKPLDAPGFDWSQVARISIFVACLLFFFVPLLSSAVFGFSLPGTPFTMENLTRTVDHPRFTEGIQNTLMLALFTTLGSLALLVPTLVYLHLGSPKVRRVAEALSLFPLVVPAVALVSGALLFFNSNPLTSDFLGNTMSLVPFYIILTMPLVYRALDAGLGAMDIKTLWSASASLGASGLQTIWRVILPNMRSAILAASLLCVALTLAEFAIASLMLQYTFPVFTVEISASQPRGTVALSFITMIVTWGLLIALSAANRPNSKPKA